MTVAATRNAFLEAQYLSDEKCLLILSTCQSHVIPVHLLLKLRPFLDFDALLPARRIKGRNANVSS